MRKAKRPIRAIDLLVAVMFAAVILVWAAVAKATEPKPAAPSQSQMQNQSAVSDSSSVSGGGQASANLYDGSETRTLAIGTTSPTPLHATPECWLPPKGIRRIRQAVYGIVTLDTLLVRNAECMADVLSAREYELAKLQAETQLERARTDRVRAEHQASCQAAADRAVAQCGADKE